MVHSTDILVAGGGVAGLSATAVFASAGFDTLCVDPVPPVQSETSEEADLRSTAFLMPSVDLLTRAGLWAKLSPYAAPLSVMRIVDAGGPEPVVRETADFVSEELDQPAFGYNLPNWLLRKEMAAFLEEKPHATLKNGVGVTDMIARDDHNLVTLSDGTRIKARLVIAADGRGSRIRDLLGIRTKVTRYGQKALVCAVAHEKPHENVSTEIHRTGGPFTLVPLPDRDEKHLSALVWMEDGAKATTLAALDQTAFETALNTRACGILGHMELATPRKLWPIITQKATKLCGPRTALIAEAAHVIPPIGAQGLNMSLRDVAVLEDLLIKARDRGGDIGSELLLSRYAAKRMPDITARIAGVDLLNRISMADAPMMRNLRRQGLRMLHATPALKHLAMRSGLGVI